MQRCRLPWPMQLCATDLLINATTSRRLSSRRRRYLPPNKRPRSRNGGRSSRPRISRENKSGSRLAFQGSNMMKLPRRQFLHLAAGAAALPAVSRVTWAQAYPSRPVRIIVGFAAGGATDILARLLGQVLSERLGQQFVNPGKVKWAAAGNAHVTHVAGELFKMMAGVNMVNVPYRGDPHVDLLGRQVDVYFSPMPASIEYIKAGKLAGSGGSEG